MLAGEHFAYQFTDSRSRKEKIWWITGAMRRHGRISLFWETAVEIAQKEEKRKTARRGEAAGMYRGKGLQKLTVVGVMKQDYDKGEETDSGIIYGECAISTVSRKRSAKRCNLKPSREYSQVLVDVDDISHVDSVEKEIKKLGYQTSSMESLRKPMEEGVRQKQMMLAGLGAVSLL